MFSKDARTISKEFHAFRFTVLARAKEFIDSNFSSCSATLLSQLYSLPFVWNLVASTCFLHLLPVSSFKVSFSSLSFLLWLPVFFISPLLFTPILPSFFPSSTFVNNLFFVSLLRSFRSFIFLFPPSNSVQRNLHPLFLSCSYFHLSFFLSASPTLYLLLYVYLTAILLLYRSATLPPPPTSSLFLLFLFLRGPSSFSVRRPSPNLAPVLSSTRARRPLVRLHPLLLAISSFSIFFPSLFPFANGCTAAAALPELVHRGKILWRGSQHQCQWLLPLLLPSPSTSNFALILPVILWIPVDSLIAYNVQDQGLWLCELWDINVPRRKEN